MKYPFLIFVLLSLLSSGLAQSQSIRYVKPTATGNGDGSSWANASGDLKAMIDASASGGQVWVASGLYTPANTLSMKNGVGIYGGFAGSETSRADRVLSYPLSTTISGGGVRQVFRNDFLDNTALLDGFVLANGKGDYGGAMYNLRSSPTVTNCSFQANRATGWGGAMYNIAFGTSSPVLTNCSFQANSATTGGAMFNDGDKGASSPVLTNCSFQANTATNGGAMYNNGIGNGTSNPVLTNCVVFGNGGNNSFGNSGAAGVSATYSLFDNTTNVNITGLGNLITAVSPFISTTSVALTGCSPAINAGNPSTTTATVGATDLAGNQRIFGGQIDMGAIEYQDNPFSVSITANPSLTITQGQSTALTALGADSYRWTTGETTAAISVSVAGPYSVTGTTGGCSSVASVTLTVNAPACGAGLSGPIWTGCVSTDWNTAGNWASGAVPTATDDVVIPSAPANQPVLSTAAVAKSVAVQPGASLSISSAGSLTINGSTLISGNTIALFNSGTVTNHGQVLIGNSTTADVGKYGIRNEGTFTNGSGGAIQIDRSTDTGLYNQAGRFTNAATLTIGTSAAVGKDGLYNNAVFINNAGGLIQIDRSTSAGLSNFATFINSSTLSIGNIAISAQDDILNLATFTNTATGEIRADRAFGTGIWNLSGSFRNDGKIFIGSVANTGSNGILNTGTSFSNTAGASIQLDRVSRGMTNTTMFVNAGQIRMGNNVPLGSVGISNGNGSGTLAAVFTNLAGG